MGWGQQEGRGSRGFVTDGHMGGTERHGKCQSRVYGVVGGGGGVEGGGGGGKDGGYV